MNWLEFQSSINDVFLARYAGRLSYLVVAQGTEMLSRYGLLTPSSSVSTILYLQKETTATITSLSQAFDHTHQMSTQRIKSLEDLGLVKKITHENDRRSHMITLTSDGLKEAEQLEHVMKYAVLAFEGLFDEISCDLSAKIQAAEQCLRKNSLADRMKKVTRYDIA